MQERSYGLNGRIAASRSELRRLAGTAMNPVTRAALARTATDLDQSAVQLQNEHERPALVRIEANLDRLEKRIRAIDACLQTLGAHARWPDDSGQE
jgi:hypothetical protein